MESGSVRPPTGALDGKSRKKKRYLLRFETFDENLKLVPVEGYLEFEFRFAWQAVRGRTFLIVNDLNPNAVGIWRIHDRKTGAELI